MAKNFTKLVSSFAVLAFSLSACGTPSDIDAVLPADQTQDVSTFSSNNTAPLDPAITSQIKASTIEETEWGTQVKTLPTVKQTKKATILSYLAFDNDKGGYRDELRQMINFHELSGTSNLMNMVLQTDGADARDMKRYLIVGDTDKNKMVSPYTSFKYERDSGDYRVLQAFAKWGFTTYKSGIKILDIDNHGGAYMGIAKDDTSSSLISLPNLAKGIKAGATKVDLLNMDACLMGTIEAVYELRDVSDVIIGSEDSTLGTGMMYTKALPDVLAKSSDTEQIATNILLASDRQGKDFLRRPNRKGTVPNVFTISAYRSKAVKPLVTEIDNLAKLMLKKMPTQKAAILSALSGTHPLNIDGDDLGGQRDLYEVLSRLSLIVTDSEIKAQVAKTRTALNKAIIISRTHNSEKNAQGMAINISSNAVTNTDYMGTAFAKDSKWDEFIVAVNQ